MHNFIDKFKFTGKELISSPAIASDGTIYIGGMDEKVYALNPDGSSKWSYQTGDEVLSSPIIGSDGTVYIGSLDKKIYALNPNGSLKWCYQTDDEVHSSPAIGSDGTVYIVSMDGHIYALNPENGSLKWNHPIIGSIISTPAIGADETLYIGSMFGYVSTTFYSRFYAFESNGTLKWVYQTEGDQLQQWTSGSTTYEYIHSSPAIGADGTVYIGSCDGRVYALNPDGSLKWRYLTYNAVVSSPAIGANGAVYIGSNDGQVYAFGFLEDNEAPEIICPADMLVESEGSLTPVIYSAIVTDNLDPNPVVVYDPEPGSEFPMGAKEVMVRAADSSGNSSICTFEVIVIDGPPEIICPADKLLLAEGSLTPITYSVMVTDNMDPNPVVVYDPEPGSEFPMGAKEVMVRATDSSGNSSICTFKITLSLGGLVNSA